MIGNKLEQSIVKIFEENFFETYSINSISKILKKSYPNINRKSNFLIREGVLGKIDIGKSYQCYLNLSNEKARIFLAIIELNKRETLLLKEPYFNNVIFEINQLAKKFPIETVVVHKRNLVFVYRGSCNKEEILAQTLLTQKFNIVLLERKEFQDHFIENIDLQKYHHVLLNVENYVNIVSELNDQLMVKRIIEKNNHIQPKKNNLVMKKQ